MNKRIAKKIQRCDYAGRPCPHNWSQIEASAAILERERNLRSPFGEVQRNGRFGRWDWTYPAKARP